MIPWREFLARGLLWLAALLLSAGVIFFVAYNWEAMGRLAHFALLDAVVVTALAALWRTGVDGGSGRALLFVLAMLTGALLALIGQTYQTGADTFELFAAWALLSLPWIWFARAPALWLFWLLLVNLALMLWLDVRSLFFGVLLAGDTGGWLRFLLNGSALLCFEIAAAAGVPWLQSRWPMRLLALASGSAITELALAQVFEVHSPQWAVLLAWLLVLASVVQVYTRWCRDLFMPAGAALSFIVVVAAAVARLFDGDAAGFLLTALLVIALSALATRWLRRLAAAQAGAAAPDAGRFPVLPSPWFVRAMAGIAGWIAAICLLAFAAIGLRFVVDSAVAAAVVGSLCCAGAWLLLRGQASDFAAQFALALSLAGQALLLLAFDHAFAPDHVSVALAMAVLQCLLFFLLPLRAHRVWSAWAAAMALAFAALQLQLALLLPGLLALLTVLFWRPVFSAGEMAANPENTDSKTQRCRDGGYGTALALVATTLLLGWFGTAAWPGVGIARELSAPPGWLGGVFAGAVLLGLVMQLPSWRAQLPSSRWRLLLLAAVPALASVSAAGLAAALVLLILARAARSLPLQGMAVLFLLLWLSSWYYTLSATLLQKSLLMLATGAALLALRLLLLRAWPPAPTEAPHAP